MEIIPNGMAMYTKWKKQRNIAAGNKWGVQDQLIYEGIWFYRTYYLGHKLISRREKHISPIDGNFTPPKIVF